MSSCRKLTLRRTKIHESAARVACSGKNQTMTKIYVGNLAKMATNDDLQQAFSQHGKVSDVSIVMDRATGQSRFRVHRYAGRH